MGGLNDMLNQIERCYEYCEKFNRKLIIDTYPTPFREDFFKYFIPLNKKIIINNENFTIPIKYSQYELNKKFLLCYRNRIEQPIDLNKDYKDKFLIHHMSGGGLLSIDCLKRFSFTDYIKNKVQNILVKLPKEYDAIHVRYTDLKTDYESLIFQLNQININQNILLCSDSLKVIDYCKKELKDKNIIVINYPPEHINVNRGIHLISSYDKEKINTASIIDLMCLAASNNFYYAKIVDHPRPTKSMSGFSRLAMMLNQDKELLTRLIYK